MSTPIENGSTVAAISDLPAPNGEKVWTVGTLSYTRPKLFVLFSWLLWGDFAWSIRDRTVVPVLQMILKKYEVSDTMAGLLVSALPALIGLLFSPIIGVWSDRYRSPRGRRIPFLLASAPIAAISIIGLGLSPFLGEILHTMLGPKSPGYYFSVIVVLAIWWTIFDVATTVTNSVFGALINDVVPSPVIGRFYGLFRAISLIVGIIFNFWLIGKAEEHFVWLFIAVGAIYAIGVISMCFKVKEGTYPPPSEIHEKGINGFMESARCFFKQGFANPYYLWFFVGSSLAGLSLLPVNIYLVFFAKHVGMSMSTFGVYNAVMFGFSLSLAYFIGSLADRFHPLPLTIAVLGLYGAGAISSFFYIHNATTFGIAMLIHGIISGTFYTVSASLWQQLLPRDIFAQIGAAGGVIGSLLYIVTPVMVGGVLDHFNHDYRLTFLMGGVIALAALGCLLVVYRYWIKYGGREHYVAPL